MRTALTLFAVLMLAACAEDGTNGINGVDGVDGESGIQVIYDSTQKIYTDYRQSIYRISVRCDNTIVSYGSGFRYSDYEVATNAHVTTHDCPDGTIKSFRLEYADDKDDAVNPASAIYVYDYLESPEYDLAKIYVPSDFVGKTVKVSDTMFGVDGDVGQFTVSMSYPLGLLDMFTLIGNVSVIEPCYRDYSCQTFPYDFMVTNDTDHGSSGSPIFDMITGEVIGVVSATLDDVNMNPVYVIDANKLYTF